VQVCASRKDEAVDFVPQHFSQLRRIRTVHGNFFSSSDLFGKCNNRAFPTVRMTAC